ncbi:MAG: 2-dehydro-3-deoxyglucarate aldolase [Bacteroidetes bacterium]|nr:2-dehydro-3-deoxyglucarate aldolase [Bacteroidota bacterium]
MIHNKTKIGTLISIDLPQIASQLSSLGFDFIFIDLEHGHVSTTTIQSIILSKQKECQIFIRISEISEAAIKYALDLGADGIIAPRVESMEEIQTLIDFSYYPPTGKRSVGFVAANQYGHQFKHYNENFKPIILAQIESKKGLELVNEMAFHPLLDGLFVGPYDLSTSMGIPGQFDAPLFIESYESIRKSCKTHHKLFGTFCSGIEGANKEIEKGAGMIAVGVDANLFLNMYSEMLKSLFYSA